MYQFEITNHFEISQRGEQTVPYVTLIQNKCYTGKSLQEAVAFPMSMGRYACD